MRFAYYDNLSRSGQAIYRKSDAVTTVALPTRDGFDVLVHRLEAALASENRRATARAASQLADTLVAMLGAPPVRLRVLSRRPSSATAELHGLYAYEEEQVPEICLWMRTAAHGRVVRFRTFLRTLVHELCHHLDYTHLGLGESFHTHGFFRRESSLVRQLAPVHRRAGHEATKNGSKRATTRARRKNGTEGDSRQARGKKAKSGSRSSASSRAEKGSRSSASSRAEKGSRSSASSKAEKGSRRVRGKKAEESTRQPDGSEAKSSSRKARGKKAERSSPLAKAPLERQLELLLH